MCVADIDLLALVAAVKFVENIEETFEIFEVKQNVSSEDQVDLGTCFLLDSCQVLRVAPEERQGLHFGTHVVRDDVPLNERHH